ncbi:MAG: helix-turn-helix transcriptional regulator [Actinobacteria bacterium]|nr:helix-turn-helix transcriptional regulator [Actinomycetota bacterium]
MHFAVRPRSPRLAPFVSALGYYESDLPAGRDRVLPGGGTDLMVNLHEDEFRTYHGPARAEVRRSAGAVLAGPDERAVVIDTADQRRGLSVGFTPAGAAAFFGVPLGETAGQLVALEQLWGRDGAVLRDRLLAAAVPDRQFAVLEEVLLARLAGPPAFLAAIQFAAAELGRGRRVADVGAELGLSPRTFTRRFRAGTGLTPKRYARIQRLQRLLVTATAGPAVDWARLAAEHGYCDQAHLIDDFRELTGVTPGGYRPRSAAEHNHLPLA